MYKRSILIVLLIIVLTLTSCSDLLIRNEERSKFDSDAILDSNITPTEDTVQFHFIDVGQGDSIFIQNGKTTVLIDSGTAESGNVVYRYLRNMGIDSLDYFIGTHPHEDHLGGAASLLTAIDVDCVFLNRDSSTSFFYENFVDVLIDKNIKPIFPDLNSVYKSGDLELKFLSPSKNFNDQNNNSLVLQIKFKDVKALFTGDAESIVETDMIYSDKDLKSDILKVGHHGSRNSSSSEFLNAVNPSVAVIQSGKGNSYGHPHKETLDRLSLIGCSVLRCDEEGSIILTTDGYTIQRSTGEKFELKQGAEKTEVFYIGNQKSKIFHIGSCPNLPNENNRVNFHSREEAINTGFKECRNCNP